MRLPLNVVKEILASLAMKSAQFKPACYGFVLPVPIPTHNKMLGGSEEKIMCHTSARFHVIILIRWILTDTKRSKKIQK